MKERMKKLMLVLAIASLGGAAYIAIAQEAAMPEEPSEDPHFEFLPHNYYANGYIQEIFLKLDCYAGQTWRFHASNPRWSPIPEPKEGLPRQAGVIARYELFTHDYLDRNGDEQQLVMRVDSVTGNTWQYRGATSAWADIPQDEVSSPVVSPPVTVAE